MTKFHATILMLPLLAFGTALPAQPSASPSASRADKDAPRDRDGKDDGDEKRNEDGTVKRAGEIATQPVRDVGLSKKKIPPILESASAAPYARPAGKCAAISAELARLNDALGPDFGQPKKKKGSTGGNLAAAGGEMVVNTFIPFRGLVREVSGAAAADRRLQAAVNAGIARRGYLRGVADIRGCRIAG
ncbi:hypothetical protein LWE61_04125 [Sphingobium sufflavum]|uniref:hypothetical protein n=1 Tax=Sphingobium sufflavum TaxID=1129547 RepID=UPI001F314F9C|nr:hypothetical protein [Sphingobium sufflavum]MCE7795742.1 hypothetical protein [Sphingobium sufflavum]